METIKLTINGKEVEAPKGSTILEAARLTGINIPTLCYLKRINAIGACRICVVEVKGARTNVAACAYPAAEGMVVETNTASLIKARRNTLELILSNHRMDCLTCLRNRSCELQKLAADFGIQHIRYDTDKTEPEIEDSSLHLVRDNSKCILCRRCVAVCKYNQAVAVIGPNDRGYQTHISCAFDRNLDESPCVSCGQCTAVCPTAALNEKDDTEKVWKALGDPAKHVVVGVAPSIRVTIGECFGEPVGTNAEGRMVAALNRLGFDRVFDINHTADLTVMEEGVEFIKRLETNDRLPLITSCSPAWIRFAEMYYTDFIPNMSSCKSPQQMFGAVIKTFYAKERGIDPKDIVTVSIMPCTAKKFEIHRENEQAVDGLPDIDIAITTRELSRMISRAGIMFGELDGEQFDDIASTAGLIFGTTGGVMEAALRTVAEIVDKKPLENVEFTEVRGVAGIKEAVYKIGGRDVRVACASGLTNVKRLLDSIRAGEKQYDFIEVMACPGGCINGGGQPVQPSSVRNNIDLREERAKAIYNMDSGAELRKSHENPLIKRMYDEYFGEPGGEKAHHALHTTYKRQTKYKLD
ncbi:MAG: NADH-dependent [FeFe] hydrogenase, group A6 [Oscillospiraceae bacterium]|nr:NADH-dependent [FeFe] hydrogenase, group A6 [Oscillospiraceae bacterium]